MPHRVATVAHRFPRRLLGACLAATAALGLVAVGAPDRLALGGGAAGGSESELAAEALTAELGAEAEPAYVLVLRGQAAVSAAATQVAVETVTLQVETIAGVGLVREGGRSRDGKSTTLDIHLKPDLDQEEIDRIGEKLAGGLDPGPLEVLVGGAAATASAARAVALDDAPKLELLALPLLALLLTGSLGIRFGAATLLGAALAAAAAVSVLGLIGSGAGLEAIAVATATATSVVLAVEAAALLLFRYREESATLGAGSEALEYSLNTVLRSAGLGMAGAALAGLALFVVPIDFARSIGAGVMIAALIGPPLALLPAAAALALRAEAEVGSALPLVADGGPAESAPRAFRLVAALARRPALTAAAVALPLIALIAFVLPVLDSEAIGLSATELPDGEPAQEAAAVLAGDFGVGAAGPLFVVGEGPAEAPTQTLYRDAIFRLGDVERVGLPTRAGELSFFEVEPDSRPGSLAAQRTAWEIRALPAPTERRVGGPGAELADAGERLSSDLPLVALIAILGSAALWSLLFRAGFGPLLALAAAVAPLAGAAAMLVVFGQGRLTGPLDYADAGAPHLTSFVVVAATLTAVALSRSAALATALAEERALGGGTVGSVARSSVLTLMPAAVGTLAGLVVAGVWGAAELVAAKEVAIGICAGLLADLLLVRVLLAPAAVRISLRSDPGARGS